MTISRWKVMACTLGLSLGGLAICAGQSNDKLSPPSLPPIPTPRTTEPAPIVVPASSKPALPSTALDTQPPIVIPSTPNRELDIALPVPATVTIPDGGTVLIGGLKAVEEKAPEKLPMPRVNVRRTIPVYDGPVPVLKSSAPVIYPSATVDPGEPIAPTNPPAISSPIPLPNPPTPQPPTAPPILVDPIPARATAVDVISLPVPVANTPPAIRIAPPPVIPPEPPIPPPAVPQAGKLKMLLRLGDGTPRFEIRSTDGASLLLKVYGDNIEIPSSPEGAKSSPIAGVTASGKVRFVGPGIEGNCDQLSVLSGTGEVLLKGNIHMKTKRGKARSEMTAEKMIYQIGTSGLTTSTSSPRVKATSYTTSP